MTFRAIRADHEEMVPGERDRIGLRATGRQTYRSADTDEVVTPYDPADAV
jgi:hypothetical protein